MGIALDTPLALLLLIPCIGLTIGLHLASRRHLGSRRRRVALLVRTVLLAALVLALARPALAQTARTHKVHALPSPPRREIPAHSNKQATEPLNCQSALNSGG